MDLSTLVRYEVGDEILLERLHPVSRHIRFYKRAPSPKDVLKYLECIFRAADLPGAVAVVAAVYLERMLERTGVSLHPGNWALALLGAVMLASKVWDDHAVWNVDFCQIFPDIDVTYLNELERWYLRSMGYNVSVKLSTYAQTFFELHELRPPTDLTSATGGDSEPPPSVIEGGIGLVGDRESQSALKRARSDFLFAPASVPLQII
ncbi:hypothetical protein HK405_005287 [Cladochytrium tenue]|nr:hypothetical protein HK405_005287 [Cladochytrium tenue]